GDLTGPGAGYASLEVTPGKTTDPPAPMILGRFDDSGWTYSASIGSDALDLTNGAGSPGTYVQPNGGFATRGEIWLSANVLTTSPAYRVVARYDTASGSVAETWCDPAIQQLASCTQSLDPDHPATLPDAVFSTSGGEVALGVDP